MNEKAGLTIRAGWCSFWFDEHSLWPCDSSQGTQQPGQSRQGPVRGESMCGLGSEGEAESSQDMRKDGKRRAQKSGLPGAWRYFPRKLFITSCFNNFWEDMLRSVLVRMARSLSCACLISQSWFLHVLKHLMEVTTCWWKGKRFLNISYIVFYPLDTLLSSTCYIKNDSQTCSPCCNLSNAVMVSLLVTIT